jgi:hypothetical protein
MTPLSPQERAELLDSVLQVAMQCPVDQTNPVACPLYAIRKLDLPQRIRWFYHLSDDELSYLASYHCVCMKTKMEARQHELCVQ